MTSLHCYIETKPLKFTFLGEPAVDEGGPMREFLCFSWVKLPTVSLLDGFPNHRIFRHNISAFQL